MEPFAEERLTPGATFGRYRIVRPLGEGGMGSVHEAVDLSNGASVALKTLHPSVSDNPRAIERFRREGELAARLSHPNIVRVTDRGVEAGVPFLVMERLDGESLARRLARDGALTDALDVLALVVRAAAFLHDAGVVHRDIKPENILLARGEDGSVRPTLLDFGVSKPEVKGDLTTLTGTGEVIGTPAYMSPEQVQGRRVTFATDVYSLGVVLYECATGGRPFAQTERLDLYLAIAKGDFTPPRAVSGTVSVALESVILRAMATNPEDRYPSARELARALEACATGGARSPLPDTLHGGSHEPVSGLASRARWRWMTATLGVLALLAAAPGLAWWALRQTATTRPRERVSSPERAVVAPTRALSETDAGVATVITRETAAPSIQPVTPSWTSGNGGARARRLSRRSGGVSETPRVTDVALPPANGAPILR